MYRKQLLTFLVSAAISGAALTGFSVNAQAEEMTPAADQPVAVQSDQPVAVQSDQPVTVQSDQPVAVQSDQTAAVQSEETAAPVSEGATQESAAAVEETEEPEEAHAEQAEDTGNTEPVEQETVTGTKEAPGEVSAEVEDISESQESMEQEETAVTNAMAGTKSESEGTPESASAAQTPAGSTSASTTARTSQEGVAGSHLEGQDKILYEASRTQLKKAAEAEDDDADGRIAAIVTVPASRLLKETLGDKLVEDAQNHRWYVNAADVGITEKIREYTDNSEGTPRKATTADPVVAALFTYNTDTIRNALLADLPYDLYWYDKTSKIDRTVHPYYNVTRLTNGTQRINFYDDTSTVSLKFPVTADYLAAQTGSANDPYTVDAAKAATAVSARNNADQVIKDTESKSLSDLDTLKAYGQTICDLTAYDYSTSQTKPYGNSWQMISVFDNDTSTNVTCEGYAKAMQYLCDNTAFKNSSVRCISVTGYLVHDGRIEDHMWNIVRWTDGNNYLVDVTNSDTGTAGSAGQFFMVPVSYTKVGDLPSDIAQLIKGKADTVTDSTGLYYAPAGTVAGSDGILYYVYDERTLRTFTQSELSVYGSSAPVKEDVQKEEQEQTQTQDTTVSEEKVTGEGESAAAVHGPATFSKTATETMKRTSDNVRAVVSASSSGSGAVNTVNTGDQEQPLIYAVMGAVAAAALALLGKKRL